MQFEPKEKDVRKRGGGDDFHRRDDDLNRRDDDYPKRGGGDDFHKREYGNGMLYPPPLVTTFHSRVPLQVRMTEGHTLVVLSDTGNLPEWRWGHVPSPLIAGEGRRTSRGRVAGGEVGKAQGMRGGVAARAA